LAINITVQKHSKILRSKFQDFVCLSLFSMTFQVLEKASAIRQDLSKLYHTCSK